MLPLATTTLSKSRVRCATRCASCLGEVREVQVTVSTVSPGNCNLLCFSSSTEVPVSWINPATAGHMTVGSPGCSRVENKLHPCRCRSLWCTPSIPYNQHTYTPPSMILIAIINHSEKWLLYHSMQGTIINGDDAESFSQVAYGYGSTSGYGRYGSFRGDPELWIGLDHLCFVRVVGFCLWIHTFPYCISWAAAKFCLSWINDRYITTSL